MKVSFRPKKNTNIILGNITRFKTYAIADVLQVSPVYNWGKVRLNMQQYDRYIREDNIIISEKHFIDGFKNEL